MSPKFKTTLVVVLAIVILATSAVYTYNAPYRWVYFDQGEQPFFVHTTCTDYSITFRSDEDPSSGIRGEFDGSEPVVREVTHDSGMPVRLLLQRPPWCVENLLGS